MMTDELDHAIPTTRSQIAALHADERVLELTGQPFEGVHEFFHREPCSAGSAHAQRIWSRGRPRGQGH